ncbi:NUDIX domain-containing protein [Pasteurellaceae bacterium HPA106]|uniref:NUDIX domain-containing protein n=1 Tax=Spirabiliibacterium pneumoniae TaxID=221400 RepID=UPI001AAC9422|nr:NUDIX domain-containing protein [Spirabiliibacterium pneumoniae]MBE2896399.1 NUDIX domain-containing protein [Spirabiliibacterium pneumoniae]
MKIAQFGPGDLHIEKETLVYDGFFKLYTIDFKHKLFAGGESGLVRRELLDKGEAAAVIAYDPEHDTVVMVEQVRIGAYIGDKTRSPWLLELVAGMVESGEKPAEVAKREAFEEAGLHIDEVEHVMSVWDSPGGITERIHMFAGKVNTANVGGLYGLSCENEDIQVHVIPREEAYQGLKNGRIDNAIAVMGLQWLQLNYQSLQKRWLKK